MTGDREKLKPCPFCGGEAETITFSSNEFVQCKMCKASSDDSGGIRKWNTRAALSRPPQESELVEALETIKSGEYYDPILGLCKAGRGMLMLIAGQALAKHHNKET